MQKLIKISATLVLCLCLILWLAVMSSGALAAVGSPEQFYRGKTITWVVGSNPGSNTDMLTRILTPYLAKQTGARVIVKNYSDGLNADNYVYNDTKPDGLTLLTETLGEILMNDVLKAPGVRYDTGKFNPVSAVLIEGTAMSISPKLPFKSLDELRRAKNLRAGSTGVKGRPAIGAAVMIKILGLDAKIISGFKSLSRDVVQAVARGELDMVVCGDTSALAAKNVGFMVPLLILDPEGSRTIPGLPTLSQLGVKIPADMEAMYNFAIIPGRLVATSPGVPRDRVAYLRKIFSNFNNISEIQKSVEKLVGIWTPFASGEQIAQQIAKIKGSKDLAEQMDALVEKYRASR